MATDPQPIHNSLRRGSVQSHYIGSFGLSFSKFAEMARSFTSDIYSRTESQLEIQAIKTMGKVASVVKDISVSEMLPRTSDIIFINVTTLEDQPFCIELTEKGWRICSLRCDCMIGDFTKLDLFVNYYSSFFDILKIISTEYNEKYAETINDNTFDEVNNECHHEGSSSDQNWSDINSTPNSSNEFLNNIININ
ncbi:Protein of unknown function DUF727 family and GSKIP domain-containing protein [Strongyloides ratti]|uniref:DUF727 domain-containing protein n=1 Tax=Strongyloides ratti TaxID=34506 RepID=A0A090L0Y1_STRRB|nr:Protein of unknown function DUF727 family and GSKIP domain-containing protein [Strongyloides ratti]CEF61752.1 Protein of unknown function DUF727 family and GSKIP domain-containing protein [Strongyloides ratti]